MSIHLPALTSVSTLGDCEIVVVALRTLAGTLRARLGLTLSSVVRTVIAGLGGRDAHPALLGEAEDLVVGVDREVVHCFLDRWCRDRLGNGVGDDRARADTKFEVRARRSVA